MRIFFSFLYFFLIRCSFALLVFGWSVSSLPVKAGDLIAPNATEFTLVNGMKVIVIPDHRAPVVTHLLFYRVGSADESSGKTGLAHFFEHLLFKGTERYPEGAISRFASMRGMEQNAMTSADFTLYYHRLAKEHLSEVMKLEADRMVNLQLTEDNVISERNVVLEERLQRVDNEPVSRLDEEMKAALYRVHPYRNPVIGWPDELAALNMRDALGFYRQHYAPANAILVVGGDITLKEVRSMAKEAYGGIKRLSAGAVERLYRREPEQLAARRLTLRDRREQPLFLRYYDVPSYADKGSREGFALNLLSHILGGGATSRFYKELVVKRGVAADISTSYRGYRVAGGLFEINAVPRDEGMLSELEIVIDAEIDRIIRGGISDEEFKRARNSVLAETIYAQDNLVHLSQVFGIGTIIGLSLKEMQTWSDSIEQVTASDVQAAARLLRPAASVTGILLPSESPSASSTVKTSEEGGLKPADQSSGEKEMPSSASSAVKAPELLKPAEGKSSGRKGAP